MTNSSVVRVSFTALIVAWISAEGTGVQAQQRGGTASDGQGSARQQRRQSLSRHPGLGAAHAGGKAVGRLQRRGHRPGWQVRVGDRPMLAGDRPGLSRHQGEPGPPFRRVREGDQELWRRDVRVAAWHPCRSRRKCVGDRRARGEPPTSSRSFPAKTRREASSSSSVPKARS